MTIKEVSERFGITTDTLRYYERVGMIPAVPRTPGGIRNYGGEELSWIELAVCMRSAGLPVEAMIEYLKLYRTGDSTLEARLHLLQEQRRILSEQKKQMESTLDRLDYKISRYQIAVKTGKLTWDNTTDKGEQSKCILKK